MSDHTSRILYLTSSPCGSYRCETPPNYPGLDPANGFLELLRRDWPQAARVLLVCAEPTDTDGNDRMARFFAEKLDADGFSTDKIFLCDCRTADAFRSRGLQGFHVVILGGGHVPTMNRYYQKWLSPLLQRFNGIVIGISAGSMNCAETVYCSPELPGEAADPDFRRFIPGFGLTGLQILPHYHAVRWDIVDGRRLIEDIICPDSLQTDIYAIPDGSFIRQQGCLRQLYGPGYRIHRGGIFPVGNFNTATPL